MGDEKDTIKTSIPEMVTTENENGVEEVSLELAKAFMKSQGNLAKKCCKRGELSHLYLSTQSSWMDPETLADTTKQRPFKQVLFALSKGLNLLRVFDQGRQLDWKDNQHRDNYRRDNRDDYRRDNRDNYRPGRRDDFRQERRDNYRRDYRDDYSPERRGYYRQDRRDDFRPDRRDDYRRDNFRQDSRDDKRRNQSDRPVVCFNFQKNGHCPRGEQCRFKEHCQKGD